MATGISVLAGRKRGCNDSGEKWGDFLVCSNVGPWLEVRDRLNLILRGWSTYFCYGTRLMAHDIF